MCVSICLPPGYGEKRREREAGRAAGGAAGITCVCVWRSVRDVEVEIEVEVKMIV